MGVGKEFLTSLQEAIIKKRTDKLSFIKMETSVYYKTQLGKRMVKAETGRKYSQNMYLTNIHKTCI